MSSNNNEIDIPASSRISAVGAEILAEQARQSLLDESLRTRLKLNLSPDLTTAGTGMGPGPFTDGSTHSALQGDDGHWQDYAGKIRVGPQPNEEPDQRLADRIADSISPGLGRIQSQDKFNPWRLDYGDPGRCKTKASVGICFTLDWH